MKIFILSIFHNLESSPFPPEPSIGFNGLKYCMPNNSSKTPWGREERWREEISQSCLSSAAAPVPSLPPPLGRREKCNAFMHSNAEEGEGEAERRTRTGGSTRRAAPFALLSARRRRGGRSSAAVVQKLAEVFTRSDRQTGRGSGGGIARHGHDTRLGELLFMTPALEKGGGERNRRHK